MSVPPSWCASHLTLPRRPDGEHRTRHQAHHALGDAPRDQMPESGAPIRGHHDQIHGPGGRAPDNLLVGDADHDAAAVGSCRRLTHGRGPG